MPEPNGFLGSGIFYSKFLILRELIIWIAILKAKKSGKQSMKSRGNKLRNNKKKINGEII